jgi:hypothetical protein
MQTRLRLIVYFILLYRILDLYSKNKCIIGKSMKCWSIGTARAFLIQFYLTAIPALEEHGNTYEPVRIYTFYIT